MLLLLVLLVPVLVVVVLEAVEARETSVVCTIPCTTTSVPGGGNCLVLLLPAAFPFIRLASAAVGVCDKGEGEDDETVELSVGGAIGGIVGCAGGSIECDGDCDCPSCDSSRM